jgi:uncharacterized lipoprotein YmbA
VARQLRVDITELGSSEDRRSVSLRARASLSDPRAQGPVSVKDIALVVPADGNSADQLVAAHRLALWRMAKEIAAM